MPKLAGAWRNLGLAYEGRKSWNKAIRAYEQYIKIAGSTVLMISLAPASRKEPWGFAPGGCGSGWGLS